MKQIFTAFLALLCLNAYAQDQEISDHQYMQQVAAKYRERAERNFQRLAKDLDYIERMVRLEDNYVEIYRSPYGSNEPEARIYYDEAPLFLKIIYNAKNYDEMIELYTQKKKNRYYGQKALFYSKFPLWEPTSFENMRIAIDPGHFAGNWNEALQEQKYLKIKAEDVGLDQDLKFYEAKINYATAEILKKKLEDLGADVYITRKDGKSAVGKSFDKWYEQDFSNTLSTMCLNGDLSKGVCEALQKNPSRRNAFNMLYKYLDFIGRARKINEWGADVTLIIHYNAKEDNPRDDEGYTKPTDENFAMAFIPGSFLNGELRKMDQRIDFLRLLFSPDMQVSQEIATNLMIDHEQQLGIPRLPVENDLRHIKYANLIADTAVYHRNLYMTRHVQGAVVYGESLYQDNIDEMKHLNPGKFTLHHLKTNKRVEEVADSYLRSLQRMIAKYQGNITELTAGNTHQSSK
jgi:N-acetylmuramoyl-L-alanine amidase